MTTTVLVALGALLGAGLLLAMARLRRARTAETSGESGVSRPRPSPERRLLVGSACGLVAFVVTRWPMAAVMAALAASLSPPAGSGSKAIAARLEAIAAWTEMLRDTLAGSAGLTQALLATVPGAAEPIRRPVHAMADRLRAGVGLVPALAQFGEDLDDAAADPVVACLVMAASERATRLGELLGALAESTRAEMAMRLEIESARASARAAVRMVTWFSLALLVLMAVFARPYLQPYGSAAGQGVLALVGCVDGFGLWLMAVMARPAAFPRLAVGPVAPA